MVIGGYSSYLALFLLDIWKFVKIISLPKIIATVKNLKFISEPFDGGSNRILAILSGNGIVYFYNISNETIISKITSDNEVTKCDFSFDGKYIACLESDGEINIYKLSQYLNHENISTNINKRKNNQADKISYNIEKKSTFVYEIQEKVSAADTNLKEKRILRLF